MTAIFLTTIERVRRELPGTFGVCAERLDAHADRLAFEQDTSFPAASVIKIAVALEVLCAIEEGTLDGSEQLEVHESDKVRGSGVLSALEAGLRLPIGDLLHLSTVISDNTAANLLIERVGVAAVNERLAALGLVTTRLFGKIFGGDGERSPATASELVALLGAIHRRDPRLPSAACERLLALLERTHTASTIGRGLPDARFPAVAAASGSPTITLAYKTGSIEGVVAEAGIVTTTAATYAVALLSRDSGDLRPNHDNIARVLLGEVSRGIYVSFTSP